MTSFSQGYSRFAYGFLVLFVICVLAGVGYSAHRERTAQLVFQLQRAQGSVLVVEDQMTQTFQLIENMMLTLPDLLDDPLPQAKPEDLTRVLNRLQLGQPVLRSLSVMTAKDGIKASTNQANVGLSVSLKEFAPSDIDESRSSVLRIGDVWSGRDFADGHRFAGDADHDAQALSFLPLAYRLGRGADSVWVLMAINTDYLRNWMERYTNVETDEFVLIRFDGRLLMSSKERSSVEDFLKNEMLSEMQHREIGTHTGQQLTAYRASSRYPFIFAIHVNRDIALAQWTSNFWMVIYWTSFALLAVLGVTLALLRRVHLSEEVQQQQQVELVLSRDQAQAATLAKSHFLATMSHEIRTPMNGVLGMTELLASTSLTDEQRQLLRVLQSSGRTLLTLIDDILDFSKIEVGKLELECIPFDLQALLDELKDTFTIQAQSRSLDLIILPLQNAPVILKGDPIRLRQVFSNLIVNAIKFTHQGHVKVVVERTGGVNEYEVSIQDTGIGINPDVQKRLFKAFTQANSSITREYGGTGLGLVISAMLVQLMNGRIWLESEAGQGSTFRFTFKAEQLADGLPEVPIHDEPMPDMGHLRVLLAEDHQINRLLVGKILNRVNIEPDFACDGVEVLERLKTQSYDVILMDLQMPNMDGLTAAHHIRANHKSKQPYIIALTANVFAEDKTKCYAAGMNDFVSKPVTMDGLVSALKKVDM